MKNKALLIFLLLFSITSFAHSGRTDSSGCHNDRKNGGYHCHSGNRYVPNKSSNENDGDLNHDGVLSGEEQYLLANPQTINSPNNPIQRDENGRIHRSSKAKNDFKKLHPCPANGKTSGACHGYVIDHIIPLACGGLDEPINMQWQTEKEGKAKDKWERDQCEQR